MPTMLGPEKFVWPTPFDAGPNAVLNTLEEYAVEIGALMRHYFPSDDAANYINNTDYAQQVANYTLDPASGRWRRQNDVLHPEWTGSASVGHGPSQSRSHHGSEYLKKSYSSWL